MTPPHACAEHLRPFNAGELRCVVCCSLPLLESGELDRALEAADRQPPAGYAERWAQQLLERRG